MTRLPRSPGLTLVLWLNQETVHRLHLAVLATMQPTLDPASHRVPRTKPTCILHTWRPHRRRPSRLFFTCTNTSQAATCTCITWPRISPHNVVNHSSHKEATIHRSSNHTWSSISPLMSALTTHTFGKQREKETEKNQIKRKLQQAIESRERQRTRSLEEDKSRTP
jgi:hypothetical protein